METSKKIKTFEEVMKSFESNRNRISVTFYHWATIGWKNKFSLDHLEHRPITLSDSPLQWCPVQNYRLMVLFEVDCIIRRPLFLVNEFQSIHYSVRMPSPEWEYFLSYGYDSLFYIPSRTTRFMREVRLRDAKLQVSGIRSIQRPDLEEIKQAHDERNTFGDEIDGLTRRWVNLRSAQSIRRFSKHLL